MWKEYKAAIITGAVFCCLIFFGLGYAVGNSGGRYHGGAQGYDFQSMESGNNGTRPGGRNHRYRPGFINPQNPAENGDQNNDDSQTAPDSNTENPTEPGNNGGSQTAPDTNGGTQTTPDTNDGVQALPNNNNNIGSLDGTADTSVYLFGESDIF